MRYRFIRTGAAAPSRRDGEIEIYAVADYRYRHCLTYLSSALQSPTAYRAGVGIVLVNPHGLVFIGRRSDNRDFPWQMPQGGLQDGETPEQGARREVWEELGIEAVTVIERRTDWLSYDYPENFTSRRAARYRGQRHRWFLLRFDGEDGAIRFDGAHPEFSAWRWTTPAEAIALVVPFKQMVYRKVLRSFAPAISAMALRQSLAVADSGRSRRLRV